jgi:electron transfer flavoprotein beta subunit
MNITVCIKQVPGSNKVEVDPVTGVLKRDGADSKMNPYDLYALEPALQLKEAYGGKVTVITMGPPSAEEVIKEAFSMGADEGYLMTDRKFAGADVLATSYTLSQGIRIAGDFDVIICGKQTTDGDTAQVGAEVAEYLGVPNVSNVLSIDSVEEGIVTLTASLDNKTVRETIKTPCLISGDGDINTPRLPSYKVKKCLSEDKVSFLSFADFDDRDESHYGLLGSATQVERIFPPEKNTEKHNVEGTPEEQATAAFELIRTLKMI